MCAPTCVYVLVYHSHSHSANKSGTGHRPFSSGVSVFYILALSFFQPDCLQPGDSGALTHESQTELLWGPREGQDAVGETVAIPKEGRSLAFEQSGSSRGRVRGEEPTLALL